MNGGCSWGLTFSAVRFPERKPPGCRVKHFETLLVEGEIHFAPDWFDSPAIANNGFNHGLKVVQDFVHQYAKASSSPDVRVFTLDAFTEKDSGSHPSRTQGPAPSALSEGVPSLNTLAQETQK